MGRQLRRVPLDFDWPLFKTWDGFVNPFYVAKACWSCGDTGLAPVARQLHDLWYGKLPFKSEDRGSTPFVPDDEAVKALASWNVTQHPEYYGSGPNSEAAEAARLCRHFNKQWSHHLNDDVAALIAVGPSPGYNRTR